MACETPLTAWRTPKGVLYIGLLPKSPQDAPLELPCGHCTLCRQEQARQWGVRIVHEAQLHEENSFITLTYNNENAPEDGNLNYADLQKFWKRLRKEVGKLSYYAVGEYGDHTNRPHYHACVFGHAFTKNRVIIRQTPTMLWTSPLLERAWGMGNVSVGALTTQTAMYTASYVTKKLGYQKRYMRLDVATGELHEMIQPRAFMSLNPAIAKNWLPLYGKAVYDYDQVVIDGRKQKPPKYYDKWLETQNKEKHTTVKAKRIELAKKRTPEENHAHAQNARARAKSKKKSV